MLTLLFFLPFLGSALLHAPVLRFDLLRVLKRPIDGGRTLNGIRLLGDNKTWRGAVVMTLGVVLATWGLSHVNAYWSRLPGAVQSTSPWWLGGILGLAGVGRRTAQQLPQAAIGHRSGRASAIALLSAPRHLRPG